MGVRKAIRPAIIELAIIVVALAGAGGVRSATADWKPQGNVEFVVGAGAGGENDRVARAIQRVLTKEHMVDSMTVLNRPGAGQIVAMNYLAGKKGDANEIGLVSGSFINAIARNGSDLNKQLTPLIKLFDAYQCYFTNVDSQYKSMADVRSRLKADPTSVTFAFPVGLGSPLHISVVNVGKAVGAPPDKIVTVVFDSGSDVSAQAAGNHIDVGVTSIGSPMPLIQAGKLRMLGIAAPERQPGELAKYPTLREQGLDVVTANPYTVVVPTGLTPEQIAFWVKALDKVLEDPDFKLDLQRNFWTLETLRYPATVKWMQDDYDENRAILTKLGLLQ
ncbi:MAG: tripartite tricarboxylate transporter substrate binding protein [Xanthobacteraceae bacterium]